MTKTCIGQGWSGNHSRILVIHMENKILHYRKERNGVSCSYVKKKKIFWDIKSSGFQGFDLPYKICITLF